MKQIPPRHVIRTPDQIRALRSAARQEIIDTLQAIGTATVPELAERLGRRPDGLYYHVKALLDVDLVRVVASRKNGRHVETVYATCAPDSSLHLHYAPEDAENTEAITELVDSMTRAAARDFRAGFSAPGAEVGGPRRNIRASRAVGWLTLEELEQANSLLEALLALFNRPNNAGPGKQLYTLTALLSRTRAQRNVNDQDEA